VNLRDIKLDGIAIGVWLRWGALMLTVVGFAMGGQRYADTTLSAFTQSIATLSGQMDALTKALDKEIADREKADQAEDKARGEVVRDLNEKIRQEDDSRHAEENGMLANFNRLTDRLNSVMDRVGIDGGRRGDITSPERPPG